MTTTTAAPPIEQVLLEQDLVSEDQLARAKRVAGLLSEPKTI